VELAQISSPGEDVFVFIMTHGMGSGVNGSDQDTLIIESNEGPYAEDEYLLSKLADRLSDVAQNSSNLFVYSNACYGGRLIRHLDFFIKTDNVVAMTASDDKPCGNICPSLGYDILRAMISNRNITPGKIFDDFGLEERPSSFLDNSAYWESSEGVGYTFDLYDEYGDADGDGIRNNVDSCPVIPNAGQSNIDSDYYGDACDPCLRVYNEQGDREDNDRDGVNDHCDNCLNLSNVDQSDTNRNGVGDLCETLPGVEVCGRVIDWKKTSETTSKWGVFEFGSTPDEIEVPYCAVGQAVNPATGGTALLDQSGQHDVQLRWCSCEGSTNSEKCAKEDCFENRKGEEARQFKHEGWHLSTYGTSSGFTTSATIWPAPTAGTCATGSKKYYPSTSCRYDAAWSAWGQDEQSDFCTYHCAPPKPVMKNPLLTGVKNMGKIQWQWRKELWWKNLVGTSSTPDARADEVLTAKTFGRLWLRPQGPEAGGPAWDKGNHYVGFKLDPGSSRSTSLGYALPVKPNPTDSVCSLVSCGGLRGPSVDEKVNWPDQVVKQ
jgi:hypothetical protein